MKLTLLTVAIPLVGGAAFAGTLKYEIYDLGIVSVTHTGSQGFGVSDNGTYATGRSLGTSGSQGYSWTQSGGLMGLPNLAAPSRPFGVGNAVNNSGVVVGTGSTTFFGSSPLPLVWQGGVVAQLPLPPGQTAGRANGINNFGVAVGSVNGGSLEVGVIYQGATATVITQLTPNGSFLRTAYGINDMGRVVGFGIDPNNPAVNVGYVLDTSTGTAFTVGALPGHNGAIAFGVSEAGHVVGASMLNQGSGMPFVWSDADGIQEVPLPVGTSQGSARGVNSAGWVVGTASSAFAIPFVFDGKTTHRVADLLPDGTDWDLSTNTSSSALGISDTGVIVGTGVRAGAVRAYALVPLIACVADLNDDGLVDGNDLTIVLGAWGPCDGCIADINDDGIVDGNDLAVILGAWGSCAD